MGSAVLGQRAAGGTLPRGTANKSQPWGCIRSCVQPHQTWSHQVPGHLLCWGVTVPFRCRDHRFQDSLAKERR
ncbi:hypothetical protein LUU34_01226800 [Aix galericulata]|nr:hypothetical protein LUU34_01226800 [Aix galericulata]